MTETESSFLLATASSTKGRPYSKDGPRWTTLSKRRLYYYPPLRLVYYYNDDRNHDRDNADRRKRTERLEAFWWGWNFFVFLFLDLTNDHHIASRRWNNRSRRLSKNENNDTKKKWDPTNKRMEFRATPSTTRTKNRCHQHYREKFVAREWVRKADDGKAFFANLADRPSDRAVFDTFTSFFQCGRRTFGSRVREPDGVEGSGWVVSKDRKDSKRRRRRRRSRRRRKRRRQLETTTAMIAFASCKSRNSSRTNVNPKATDTHPVSTW